MLNHPTVDKLYTLKCLGMAKALEEQMGMPETKTLNFEERLGLLVDREITERERRRLRTRLKAAKLRQSACIEDIDFRHRRGLDKSLILSLASSQWVQAHHNVLITGPTGVGKSFIASALGHKVCRDGYSAHYIRIPRLFSDLALAKGDGLTPRSSPLWPKKTCWFWMTGGSRPSPRNNARTFWRSSKTVMTADPP